MAFWHGTLGNDDYSASAGDDELYGYDGADTIRGGAGKDLLNTAGYGGGDLLDGGDGDDSLYGGRDHDTLLGGRGNDYLDDGYGGDDFLDGGDGDDTLFGGNGHDTLLGGSGNDFLGAGDAGSRLDGGLGQDTLQSGTGNDLLLGGEGNDILWGWMGQDTLSGGDGDDELHISSTSGNSVLDGGSGNDFLYAGSGADSLAGGSGNDYLFGDAGDDRLDGGDGADLVSGGKGDDRLAGGKGADFVYGDEGDDRLEGGSGNDVLMGGNGNDTLDGGSGADLLWGDSGFFGGGNDTYYLDNVNDRIHDSAGSADVAYVSASWVYVPKDIETVIYTDGAQALPYFISALYWGNMNDGPVGAARTIQYSFVSQTPAELLAHLTGFIPYTEPQKAAVREALACYSAVAGLKFVEVADSSAVKMRFLRDDFGSSGDAGVASAGGPIHIKAGTADFSKGSYGFQTLLHEIGHSLYMKHPFDAPALDPAQDTQANTVMTYNIAEPYAQNLGVFDLATMHYLYGVNAAARAGNDTYTLGEHYLWDGAGVDTLSAAGQAQAVSIDLAAAGWSWAGAKSASILAAGQSFIGFGTVIENATGGAGADRLAGNAAANVLKGGAGADTLAGGAGKDTLIGGSGHDQLTGGTGQDAFRFTDTPKASTSDLITDFSSVDDRLEFGHTAYAALGPVGALAAGAFATGTAAREADDRLIYDQAHGELRYDADGSGAAAAVLIARLGAGTALGVGDLFVV